MMKVGCMRYLMSILPLSIPDRAAQAGKAALATETALQIAHYITYIILYTIHTCQSPGVQSWVQCRVGCLCEGRGWRRSPLCPEEHSWGSKAVVTGKKRSRRSKAERSNSVVTRRTRAVGAR